MIIAQITDSHIMTPGEAWYNKKDTKTAERLISVVKQINSLNPRPDIVIHTGDIVGTDDIIESYLHAKEILDKLQMPYFLTCGNHDQYHLLKEAFPEHIYLTDKHFAHYVLEYDKLRIIVVDSTVAGKHFGELCAKRLKWLTSTLATSTKDTMLFMHHYPINVRNDLMTQIKLRNCDELSDIINPLPYIKGIFCGHYHYHAVGNFADTLCWISPSTAPTHELDNHKCIGLNLYPASYSLHHYSEKALLSMCMHVTEQIPMDIEADLKNCS